MARILVVDDSATEVFQLVGMLEKQGHEVLTASTGAEAIELARRETPELVLMDVVMPEMNGFQATREITRGAETGHIPVVIISSKNQDADRIWGERQGACGYLTKPVAERALLDMIAAVLTPQDVRR